MWDVLLLNPSLTHGVQLTDSVSFVNVPNVPTVQLFCHSMDITQSNGSQDSFNLLPEKKKNKKKTIDI